MPIISTASPMAYTSASPRHSGTPKASPRKTQLEDGPIRDLIQVIEDTRPEQWQKRSAAFSELVAQIPSGAEYSRREAWYNSPPTLRHLHRPIGELLTDPRSTVVKRTCESLNRLFALCQGDAKYLLKDLMPTVLNVHAQTVQVIRNQVQTLVLDTLPVVPCKMAMPLWLDRLKTDKSRTVREACVLYLGMGMKHWSLLNGANPDTPYLSEENWTQIATAMIKVLRDPSPTVRSYAKQGISTILQNQPNLWDDLIRDPNGPAAKDAKLQKWLIKVTEQGGDEFGGGPGGDDLSVASRFSNYSSASKANANQNRAPSTPGSRSALNTGNRPSSRGRAAAVPLNISVGGGKKTDNKSQNPPRSIRQGLGPPLRRPFASAVDPQAHQNSPTHNQAMYGSNVNGYPVPQLGTPPRPPVAPSPIRGRATSGSGIQQRSPSPSPRRPEPRHEVPLRSRSESASSAGGSGTDLRGEDVSESRSITGRNRARPTPEGIRPVSPDQMNGNSPRVIDLVDTTSPQHQQQAGAGVYSHASSTQMLDVTKSIDQTLANPYLQQQQQNGEQLPDNDDAEGPFIASMNELKQCASRRRSRRSIHMQERWSRGESIGSNMGSPHPQIKAVATVPADAVSSLGGSLVHNPHAQEHHEAAANGNGNIHKPMPPTPTSALPEHYVIAEQLLRVHKTHVDQIMETLKIEMDTLRDFEQSLEQDQAPSPDQVLDYFESVGLCLDQRTTAGNILQREMDRISKGAFSMTGAGANNNNNQKGAADNGVGNAVPNGV